MAIQASRDHIRWRQAVAWFALATLFTACLLIVLYAAAGPSPLVSGSTRWSSFPGWLAGPLHGLFGRPQVSSRTLDEAFSALVAGMTVGYFIVLWSWRSVSMRVLVVFVVAVEAVLLIGPPLQMTDLFNYLAYARLGAVHGLNPYTHVINAELRDPTFPLSTWHNWRSPYGTLFTAITYPAALLPLPAAYWTMKVATVLMSLAFLWLVGRCARLLGRDPRLAVLLVAANPIYLIYAVAEFHNDFFMLVPAMGAVALLLSGRYRSAGAALAVAVAVKMTMVLLLPFLLLAAWRQRAARGVAAGFALAAAPLAALSLALFGPALPNVSGQSQLLTGFSIPNLLGWTIGLGGGTPQLIRDMDVLIVLVVGYQLLRRRDWLSGAGWATLALLASLGWLMPWYVVWLLPLAAIAPNVKLRRMTLAASVFLILAFLPATGLLLNDLRINPLAGPVGLAAWKLEWNGQWYRRGVIQPWVRETALRESQRCRHAGFDCDRTLRRLERRGV
ncbi:MAG TPA: hypothetical protein VFP55_00710 [Solirubrobacteraceae bacterium]|nr:hypothetical protein [Solirubrobacteraceae bacterium]